LSYALTRINSDGRPNTFANAAHIRIAPWCTTNHRLSATHTKPPSSFRPHAPLTRSALLVHVPVYARGDHCRLAYPLAGPMRRALRLGRQQGMGAKDGRNHPSRVLQCQRHEHVDLPGTILVRHRPRREWEYKRMPAPSEQSPLQALLVEACAGYARPIWVNAITWDYGSDSHQWYDFCGSR